VGFGAEIFEKLNRSENSNHKLDFDLDFDVIYLTLTVEEIANNRRIIRWGKGKKGIFSKKKRSQAPSKYGTFEATQKKDGSITRAGIKQSILLRWRRSRRLRGGILAEFVSNLEWLKLTFTPEKKIHLYEEYTRIILGLLCKQKTSKS
jgi:hypothetical protein